MADLQEKGYNKEEEYFYKQNKELIEKRRRELDAKRKAQPQHANPHWMKCPKCGADMKEIERQGIKVDQCGQCEGIYFDRGELELLMDAKEQKGFLGGLKSLLK